jgi:hypothetical protein
MSKAKSSFRIIFLGIVFLTLSLGQVLFFEIDRCLDARGAFDYNAYACNAAAGYYVSLFQGGGTIQLWVLILFGSSAATFILDRSVRALVAAAKQRNAS